MALKIDEELFGKRLAKLYASFKDDKVWNGADAIAIGTGPSAEEIRYLKSISLHLWLFGYELPGATPSREAAVLPPPLVTRLCVCPKLLYG
eukprot:8983065-Pyramimonas_sp.AAC.1